MISDELILSVTGISHKNSKLSEREVFQISTKELGSTLDYFKSIPDVQGIVIVPTCNRLEYYTVIKKGTDPFLILEEFYRVWKKADIKISSSNFYSYEGMDAVKHLFKVIAGLDSMVMGEYQIQGQIKDAYSIACSSKTADKTLHKLFHAAFRTGKAVRTRTKIGKGNRSLGGVAFKLLKEKLTVNDTITIIGVNQNTKILAENLKRAGFFRFNFVNRTIHKAQEMAEKFGGNVFSLLFLEEAVASSTCIISCTSAPDFIIGADLLNKNFAKMNSPKIVIDLAVPRDIDTVGLINTVEYYDLEGLSNCLEKEKQGIILEISEAERIISEEVRLFEVWNEAQTYKPYELFDEKIELSRLQLLNEIRVRHSDEELELLDKFSRSLIHRIKSTVNQAIKVNLDDAGIHKAG
jgi:glutamyl-tRNA reductase